MKSTKFKNTEVGLLPVDWEVNKLAELGKFKKGRGIRKDDVIDDGLPCVRYGELYTHHNEYIKKINSFISPKIAKDSLKISFGDILFAGSGETKEEIGKCAAYLFNADAFAGGDIIVFSPNDSNPLFLGYILNSNLVIKQKAQFGQGDAVVHIYTNNIKSILIPLPPLPEQKAIAEVLSDTDNLIASLEKLIAKKKMLKQGAMQELLTGKKRLPGFTSKWETKKLGEVCNSITTGKLDANAMKENGEYRFYTCAKEYYFIDKYAFDTEALLISGNGANVGYIHYFKGKFNAYQRTYVLSDFQINIKFIKIFLEIKFKMRINEEVNAGNTPYIKMNTISEMIINFPQNECEQTAIVDLLSEMDAELEALEHKLEKYRQIKQGMMQELLTGRVRLIKN